MKFPIPSLYEMPEMTYEVAKGVLIGMDGKDDLLAAMEAMDARWNDYCESSFSDTPLYEDDDEFFATWVYEVNAYNVVFDTMAPLFATKGATEYFTAEEA